MRVLTRAKSEKGVLLIIAAIMFIPIFITVAVFFIDTGIVKNENDKFSTKADGLCKILADEPLNQESALRVFRDRLNSMISNAEFGRVDITAVKVVIPTMPDVAGLSSSLFGFSTGDVCQDNSSYPVYVPPPYSSPAAASGMGFSSIISDGVACNLFSGVDCNYVPDFCPSGSALAEVPVGFANNLSGAGNVVACFFEGQVNTIFSGTKQVKFSTSWKRIIKSQSRGQFNPQDPLNTSKSAFIGISSFFPAPVNDPRYRFDIPTGYQNSIEQVFGPFRQTSYSYIPGNSIGQTPGTNYGIAAFINPSTPHPFPNAFVTPSWFQHFNNLGITRENIYQLNGAAGAGGQNDNGALFEQLFVSCTNPISLARNIFLRTLVELFSMHGDLRHNTTILHANPQPRNPPTRNGVSSIVSQATAIRLRGEDLRDFAKVPFLSYFDGFDATAAVPANLKKDPAFGPSIAMNQGVEPEAFLFPFDGTGLFAWTPRTNQHHTLVSSLARFCVHMFSGASAGGGNGLDAASPYIQANNLAPANIYPQPIPPVNLYPQYPNPGFAGGTSWDPVLPWAPDQTRCNANMQGTQCLNTSEVMMSLPAWSACPAGEYIHGQGAASLRCTITNPANSAGNGPDDFRADLAGLLGFAAGNPAFDAIVSPGQFLPDITPPGRPMAFAAGSLYGTVQTPGGLPANVVHPFPQTGNLNFYVQPDPNETPIIILVFHRRPAGPDEYSRINAFVNSIPPETPIFFVYFPTTSIDSAPAVIQQLQAALNILPGGGGDPNNQLVLFSPYDINKFGNLYNNNAGTANEWQDYSAWLRNEIFNPNSPEFIGKAARRFVYFNVLDYQLLW